MHNIITVHHNGFENLNLYNGFENLNLYNDGGTAQEAAQDQASVRLLSRTEDQMQWRLALQ
jgi:hypothetical protein